VRFLLAAGTLAQVMTERCMPPATAVITKSQRRCSMRAARSLLLSSPQRRAAERCHPWSHGVLRAAARRRPAEPMRYQCSAASRAALWQLVAEGAVATEVTAGLGKVATEPSVLAHGCVTCKRKQKSKVEFGGGGAAGDGMGGRGIGAPNGGPRGGRLPPACRGRRWHCVVVSSLYLACDPSFRTPASWRWNQGLLQPETTLPGPAERRKRELAREEGCGRPPWQPTPAASDPHRACSYDVGPNRQLNPYHS